MIYVTKSYGGRINVELSFLRKRKKIKYNKKITTCIFQTMTMNSFLIQHDAMRGQWQPMHICKHQAICSFMMAEL